MNIIANTCTSAMVYRDYLKEEYPNPFCWNFIAAEDYFNLIKNFDTLNFENFELIKKENFKFYIKIDNLVEVYYPHYRFDKNKTCIAKIGNGVYYNKMWEYVVQKYEERTKRMLNKKEEPIFIIGSSNRGQQFTQKEQEKFLELTKYKMFLFSKYKFEKEIPNNITVINSFNYDNNNSNSVKIIYNIIK